MNCLKTTFIDQEFNNDSKINQNNDDNIVATNIASSLMSIIINALPGVVYWKNKEGVYLWHNSFKEEDRQKYRWPSNIVGKTDHDLFPQNVADEARRHDLEIMLSDDIILRKEAICCLTGETYIHLSYKKALKDEQGTNIGIVGCLVDITSVKSRKMQPTSNICVNNFKNYKKLISYVSNNLQTYIKEPLKEVLLLINILGSNEDKGDNLALILEIKDFIKTLFNNYNNILNGGHNIKTKRRTICKSDCYLTAPTHKSTSLRNKTYFKGEQHEK